MCVSPLKGFQIGVNPSGKPDYKITSYKVHHIENIKGSWQKVYDDFESPYAKKIVRKFTEIPCGYCIDCRLNYSKMWANRIMLEASDWKENYFLTLTYDNEHLPFNDEGLMTLRPKDLQDFLKRLRRHFEPNILRFFACGEYGDASKRPHYHAIIFNLPLVDKEYYARSDSGYPIYISETLRKIWSHGHVIVASMTWESAAYVARYTMKKAGGRDNSFYEEIGIEPEFLRMSRRPGIAASYFDKWHEKIYDTDSIVIGDVNGGKTVKPPRYFDKKLESINENLYSIIKERRKMIAENHKKLLLLQTRLTYEEILKNRELKIKQKTLALKRQL